MPTNAEIINQRLSLRKPLKEALDILVALSDKLELKKEVDLTVELEKVNSLFATCTDFEREFPSICFSIATGVGKTRLMGAYVTYLYTQKGIRNFFILAPNITIYEKLIEDFGNPGNPKYVFNGIAEFVHNRPIIITGDNYNQQSNLFSKEEDVRINIFNIAKFNSDNKTQKKDGRSLPPRIKRLSEYLGQSYWEYLSGLSDLVILMDEAHRYHADASKNAINELKPILGIELTATPMDDKGNVFRNIVYEYSLAQALKDGKYVKHPTIAKRMNFKPDGLSEKEIENIKLEDAISIHVNTKNELEVYANTYNKRKVKPFILVVCKDITHAKETFAYIESKDFYKGDYKGKVLQIDSSTKNEEDISKQFLSLEHDTNEIEIVIHVNMLKEGWDVTNLYTIVPLRAANANILIEQTIGRGLRLPYNGERTGVENIDKLTVVAHDNFDKVIEASKDPNSLLNKMSFIELSEEELKVNTTVVTSTSKQEVEIKKEEEKISQIKDETKKQEAQTSLDAKKAILSVIPSFGSVAGVTRIDDLQKPEIKEQVIAIIQKQASEGSLGLFSQAIALDAEKQYEAVVSSFKKNVIEIPRIDLVQEEVRAWFEDFELQVENEFDYSVLSEEIHRRSLVNSEVDTIQVKVGALFKESPTNQIISELMNFPEVDYDENADLLQKLSNQAIRALSTREEDKLPVLVHQYRKIIAVKIYDQLKGHLKFSEPEYLQPKVLPFEKIENWNFTVMNKDGYKDYRDSISPVSLIPKYVFRGFEKACHFEYKFDTKQEKDFAYILENDKKVIKWLRPARNQFRIYYAKNSRQYHPDFVVEADNTIYLVEIKASNELNDEEVLDKKKAAVTYCRYSSEYTSANQGKAWKYLLIPHDEVTQTNTLEYFANRFIC